MKKRFVILNTRAKLPLNSTVLYSFLLYYFKVNDLYWDIFITLFAIIWIVCIYAIWTQEVIDLNTEEKEINKKLAQSKFAKKLLEIINKSKEEL